MGNSYKRDAGKDSTVLTEDQIVILLNNTSFDRDEILDWHKGFLVNWTICFYEINCQKKSKLIHINLNYREFERNTVEQEK